jgi:hypothetical protein
MEYQHSLQHGRKPEIFCGIIGVLFPNGQLLFTPKGGVKNSPEFLQEMNDEDHK